MVNLQQRKNAFLKLGKFIWSYLEWLQDSANPTQDKLLNYFHQEMERASLKNPWFTTLNIQRALEGIQTMLSEKDLDTWLENYDLKSIVSPATIGVVMAGNIPAVGFHDFMCILLSGHHFQGKLSSDDAVILPAIWNLLLQFEPKFAGKATFTTGQLKTFDAIIATGSNNTARYFDYYFGKYPHIIRQNRNGVAVIDGNETVKDFEDLAADVFSYFGLGCRNVSFLLVPESFDFELMFSGFAVFDHVSNHHKYYNNYLYNKSLLIINKENHYDNGFVLLVQKDTLASPIGVLHYQTYKNRDHLLSMLAERKEQIQCVVSRSASIDDSLLFGVSQKPKVQMYADGIDTMHFLLHLRPSYVMPSE